MIRIAFVLVTIFTAGSCLGQTVHLTNTMDEPIDLYVWKTSRNAYERTYFGRQERKPINCDSPGKYYVVIRDSLNRDLRVGWVDLRTLSASELAIDVLYQNRGKATIFGSTPSLLAYSWQPTCSQHYAMSAKLVPYTPGRSFVEIAEQLDIDPTTGNAEKREQYTVRDVAIP
jgi:hypothetical protein